MKLLFVIAFCLSVSLKCVATLIFILCPGKARTGTASNNLLRCVVGASATAAVVPMINGIAIGWSVSVFAFLNLAASPF